MADGFISRHVFFSPAAAVSSRRSLGVVEGVYSSPRQVVLESGCTSMCRTKAQDMKLHAFMNAPGKRMHQRMVSTKRSLASS